MARSGQMMSLLSAGLLLALLAQAVFGRGLEDTDNRAAYFLQNYPTGNSIVSMKISSKTGQLSEPFATPTGGFGLLGVSKPNPEPGFLDSLFGQNGVVVYGNYLFTVNPGSNTVSMFLIDNHNPWRPTLLGMPASSIGEFPMSVAYSDKLKTACVLNGGAIAGVVCFSVDSKVGLTSLDELPRSIAQALHQTTPPIGAAFTASDLLFNPSSTALFAVIKGNATAKPGQAGYMYAWPVDSYGRVSYTPVITSIGTIPVPYSAQFLGSDSRLFITDPSFGASIVHVSPLPALSFTEEKHIPIPFSTGACWSAWTPAIDSVYVIDGTRPNITVIDPTSGNIKTSIVLPNTSLAGFDAAIDRTNMYLLAGDAAVLVIDLIENTVVQNLNLTYFGTRTGMHGMATFPSTYM